MWTASWSLAWRTSAPPTRGRDESVEVESLMDATSVENTDIALLLLAFVFLFVIPEGNLLFFLFH